MLPKFALADKMQDLRRRSIAQASQTSPTAQRRNQAQRVSTRKTERRSFPLSFAQQRLWVLDRLEPGNGVYNLAFAVRLDGALDPNTLQSALNEVASRHEILRAEFNVEGDAPCPGGEASVGAFVNVCNVHQAVCCDAGLRDKPQLGTWFRLFS